MLYSGSTEREWGGGGGWRGGCSKGKGVGGVVYIHLLHLSLSSTCINAQHIGMKNKSKKRWVEYGEREMGGRGEGGGGKVREKERTRKYTRRVALGPFGPI